MKKISIIVPVYNVQDLLPRCLDSICAQTLRDLEIILVDDGATDASGRICDEYALRDPRIRVVHQANAGLAGARNAGLELASGDYVGFVDSDDRIAPDMYEILLDCITRYDADIALCGRYLETEAGETQSMWEAPEPMVFDSHEAVRRLLRSDGMDAAAWDKLYRRELFGQLRYPLKYVSEDIPVTYRLLCRAKRIVHCGKPLYYYLQRAGSLSHAAFSEKTLGLHFFHKEVGLQAGQDFPDLKQEGNFYFYRGMLVPLFRHSASGKKDPLSDQLYEDTRKNLPGILRNRFLPLKYKIFALSACVGMDRLAYLVGERFGINDNSLTK